MGAHSNYLSIEFDLSTVMFIFISLIVGVILYFTFKLITCIAKRYYYKQFRAEQRRVDQYKQITARKERAYQRTLNNFLYNRIEEDIEEMSEISSDVSDRLIDLYQFEVK